nr:165_t:CDS:1 [Entrophospora candida]
MGQEYSWADHWKVFEWFKTSSSLHHLILLVLIELKDSSEQSRYILEESLKDLECETKEIFDNVQKSPSEYLKIIGECRSCILTPNNEGLRQSLVNEILRQEKLPNGWLPYLIQITDSQRTVLKTMAHQNIQARVAYIRAISKPHLDQIDSEGYHYTRNPYYRQVMNEKNEINVKYNELLANNNAGRSNSDQGSSHDDEGEVTLQKKFGKMNKKFEREFERINQQLLENMKINTRILEENKKINDKNTQSNAQILESVKENKKINTLILTSTQFNAQNLEKNKKTNAQILENTQNLKSLDFECDRLSKENNVYKKETENIKNQLTNAEQKALNLEAALGDATNVRLSDESPNNSLQLKNDITKFKKLVENFIKVKGRHVQIKEQAANDLLLKYKFRKNNDTFKDVLGFILQNIIIDKVLSAMQNLVYKDENGKFNCLESAIMSCTDFMIKSTTELSQLRNGDDHVTKMTPIKIRQQIYEALALRGFNNSNDKFINSIRDDIVNEMNKYREIIDEDRKKNIYKNADELVRTGIKLWFRLKIQEPVVNIEWYKPGDAVDTNFMEGTWETDNTNNFGVELCYFPCILSKGKETEIYYKSQVTIRKKSKSWWQT